MAMGYRTGARPRPGDNVREACSIMKDAARISLAGSALGDPLHGALFTSDDDEYRVLLPFIKDGFECGQSDPGRQSGSMTRSVSRIESWKSSISATCLCCIDRAVSADRRGRFALSLTAWSLESDIMVL